MLPPCFRLADEVYPLVRQRAAKLLAEAGATQIDIARRLDVSQAMVSKYLKAQPADPSEEVAWIVEEMAQEVAVADEDEVVGATEPGHSNAWCRTFAQTLGPEDVPRRHVVADTARILGMLQDAPVAPLVPAVSVNVAGCLPEAAAREHVAAFPGRLAMVRGRLRAHGPPEFGASRHLAAALLRAREAAPDLRFVVNLRGDDAVLQAARRNGEAVVVADAAQRDEDGVPGFACTGTAVALHDPGAHGIEPALYLFDAGAGRLAERVARLARAVR